MGEAYFYHLTERPLEVTLRVLLQKSVQAGWRVAIRGRTEATLRQLDEQLWLQPHDSFLPHGCAGGDHDGAQPILLTTGVASNDPRCIVSVEGAEIAPGEVGEMARVMVLFDGHDEASLQVAREQWKTLTAAGCGAKYWSEASGRWEMKAESAGS
ncbi:MAG: DNA polymerase III subunit chi [Roseicyclus sp.]|nr:DNA polymerase III subunit chi [Roseicyclus sp.]